MSLISKIFRNYPDIIVLFPITEMHIFQDGRMLKSHEMRFKHFVIIALTTVPKNSYILMYHPSLYFTTIVLLTH